MQLLQEFFDPREYINNEQLPLSVDFEQTTLNSLFGQTKQVNVYANHITYKPSWFNNRLPFSGDTFETFAVENTNFGVSPIEKQATSSKVGFLNYILKQSNVKRETEFDKNTLTDLFIALGGFISMITRLTNFIIRGYQGYAIDKSLIKKVFSVRKPKQERS